MYVMSRMRIQEDQNMYTRDSGLTSGRQHSDVLMRPCLCAHPQQVSMQLCTHCSPAAAALRVELPALGSSCWQAAVARARPHTLQQRVQARSSARYGREACVRPCLLVPQGQQVLYMPHMSSKAGACVKHSNSIFIIVQCAFPET